MNTLFPEAQQIDKVAAISLFKIDFETGIKYLTSQGMPLNSAVAFYIKNCFSIDWVKLWNEFENCGRWCYLQINYKGHLLRLIDGDTGYAYIIVVGDRIDVTREFFEWSESDVFDSPTKAKVTNAIQQAIFEVVAYLDAVS